MEFFLVRSANTYHKPRPDVLFVSPKMDTEEEAIKAAVAQATKTRETQFVYKLVLIGKAEIEQASWKPETGQANCA